MQVDAELIDKAIKIIGIRFPNAQISRDLKYSKGIVSEYLNGKKLPSENFIESFENFYKIRFSDLDSNEPNQTPETDMDHKDEIIRLQRFKIDTLEKDLKECREQLFFRDGKVQRHD